jgi:hypothetical protein
MRKSLFLFLCFFLFFGLSYSQEQYGNIRGIVQDDHGQALPGVAVTLESELYGSRSTITSESGVFRFLNASIGLYRLKCEISGLKTYIQENIYIRVGLDVDLKISMEQAIVAEDVTVIAKSPVVDLKKTGVVVHVTEQMLQEIPSARDPWVILQQASGILVSNENVGGSESGKQSVIVARGNESTSNMWSMDGITITDMVGYSSPSYYDFDMFEEMQIVTAGNDASIQTGGVAINFISRRGTNKLSVMGRVFYTDKNLQSDNRTQELEDLGYVGNKINQIMDYGLQLGGPIKRDKIWFWAGLGVQDVRRLAITGYPDERKLTGLNTKLNFQLSPNNRAELAFMYTAKKGESIGLGATRPPETTDDLDSHYYFIKLEDEHVFSNNFMLTLKLAYNLNRFEYTPRGGTDTQVGLDLGTGLWSGSFIYNNNKRPSNTGMIAGNYFIENVLGGDHEFKFGIEFRSTPVVEEFSWAGDAFKYYINGMPLFAEVSRQGLWDIGANRYSFYINNTYTRGRLTLNLGIRFDRERSWNNDASVEASTVGPEILPALTYPGGDPGVAFLTFSPRVGFTYDITGDGKTILRANIARYGAQQGTELAKWISTSSDAWARYFWTDANGDDRVTTDELYGYPTQGILAFGGFDPRDPANLETLNMVDKNLKTALTDELILGLEREMFTDFSLGANLILRRNYRFPWEVYYDKETQAKITKEDYIGPISGSLTVDGKTYNYEYWTLSQFRPSGLFLENNRDYYENYTGFEIQAKKRFSHKWLMNASFTYQILTVHYGDGGGNFNDPTNVRILDGSRRAFLGSDWITKMNFLYQLPWQINMAFSAHARQGYVRPMQIRINSPERAAVGLGGIVDLYIEPPGETHYPTFINFDISLSKDIHISDYGTISFIADAFNIFNFNHTLRRYNIVNSSRFDEIEHILNPRVIRFGIRYRY